MMNKIPKKYGIPKIKMNERLKKYFPKNFLEPEGQSCFDCGSTKNLLRSMFRIKCFDCANKRGKPVVYSYEKKKIKF